MMQEAIKNFPKQFAYEPKIENEESFRGFDKFIVVGMGGSHLAADLLKTWNPYLQVSIHKNYGLPAIPEKDLKNSLIIASSYSGNTEETLDAFKETVEKDLAVVAVSTGGKLLELAKEHSVPYIQLPDTGIQPRSALGFAFKALLKFMSEEDALEEVSGLADSLDSLSFENAGKELAEKLKGKVPVIYSSSRNLAIAYNWKIKFNETGKIPAFFNIFPELNHNEMTGLDVKESTKALSENFYFIFLKDEADHQKAIKGMEITEKLYVDRGLPVQIVSIAGESPFLKIFSSLLLADWTAYYTAVQYNVEPEQVPMVEEFKKLIA